MAILYAVVARRSVTWYATVHPYTNTRTAAEASSPAVPLPPARDAVAGGAVCAAGAAGACAVVSMALRARARAAQECFARGGSGRRVARGALTKLRAGSSLARAGRSEEEAREKPRHGRGRAEGARKARKARTSGGGGRVGRGSEPAPTVEAASGGGGGRARTIVCVGGGEGGAGRCGGGTKREGVGGSAAERNGGGRGGRGAGVGGTKRGGFGKLGQRCHGLAQRRDRGRRAAPGGAGGGEGPRRARTDARGGGGADADGARPFPFAQN